MLHVTEYASAKTREDLGDILQFVRYERYLKDTTAPI